MDAKNSIAFEALQVGDNFVAYFHDGKLLSGTFQRNVCVKASHCSCVVLSGSLRGRKLAMSGFTVYLED